MNEYHMFVELKIPDTTKITAFHTLLKLGFDKLQSLKRYDYYEFETEENLDLFRQKITKADVLVNANKHKASVLNKNDRISDKIGVLINDTDADFSSLLTNLKHGFDIDSVAKISKGVYWEFDVNVPEEQKEEYVKAMVRELLYNPHYQDFEVY